jgi:hypothetical protein
MMVGSVDDDSQRNSSSIRQETALNTPFAAIGDTLSGRDASERGGSLIAPSDFLSLPLDPLHLMIEAQSRLP